MFCYDLRGNSSENVVCLGIESASGGFGMDNGRLGRRRHSWSWAAFAVSAVVLAGIGLHRWQRTPASLAPMASSARGGDAGALARVAITIEGMDCVMCAASLQNHLRGLPGVQKAEVSFQDKLATLEYNPALVTAARIESAIRDAGFKVAGSNPGRGR